MPINITKKDVKWSYLSILISNGVNLLLLPVVVFYLNSKELGIWYTFTAIYGIVILLDLGLLTTLSRQITYIWSGAKNITKEKLSDSNLNADSNPNYNLFYRVFFVVKNIYSSISWFILIILASFGTLYILNINEGTLSIKALIIAWVLYMFSIFLNMRFAYWSAIFKGIGHIKSNQVVLVVSKIFQLFFSVLFLYYGLGLIGISAAYLISVIVNRSLSSYLFNKIGSIRESKNLYNKKFTYRDQIDLIKILLPNTIKQSLVSISNYLMLSFPILISSYFLDLATTAKIGLTVQVLVLITTVANTLFNTYLPQLNHYRITSELFKLKDLFKRVFLINNIIVLVIFILLYLFGNGVLNIMNADVSLLDRQYLILFMLYIFLYNNQSLCVTFLSTKNSLPYYRSFLFTSVVIVTIQIFFLIYIDENILFIVLPIILGQMIYNNWKWPYTVLKELKLIK